MKSALYRITKVTVDSYSSELLLKLWTVDTVLPVVPEENKVKIIKMSDSKMTHATKKLDRVGPLDNRPSTN